jgi:hypothetical protein
LTLNALQQDYSHYIRVTNVALFNAIVAVAERKGRDTEIMTSRRYGYYELRTSNVALWRELYLYGQMIAQSQDEFIEAGED